MNILVTGASGFVGGPVCRALAEAGFAVTGTMRQLQDLGPGIRGRTIGELGPETDWSGVLSGMDAIVHLAARAHVMNDQSSDPLALFRRVNRDGTLRLAEQAVAAGIRRFIFISSIKVNGEANPPGRPMRADDAPTAQDPYGMAKTEAEQALTALAGRTGLELTILRPPLVHGPGAKGNLRVLMGLVRRGWPLPLGAIANRRSLIGVGNLADAIRFCLTEPRSIGGTYLLRDGEDLSTADLVRRLGELLGRPPRLLPIPARLLGWAGRLVGRSAAVARLCGSLTVDDAPLRALGWTPPVSLDDGLAAMAAQFRLTEFGG